MGLLWRARLARAIVFLRFQTKPNSHGRVQENLHVIGCLTRSKFLFSRKICVEEEHI